MATLRRFAVFSSGMTGRRRFRRGGAKIGLVESTGDRVGGSHRRAWVVSRLAADPPEGGAWEPRRAPTPNTVVASERRLSPATVVAPERWLRCEERQRRASKPGEPGLGV